jgi:hypothetical protein
MRSFRRYAAVALLTGLAALVPALPAAAASGSAALSDCNAHDTLTHTYTAAELRDALATMPATMKEYTDCQDVITRALDTALGNGGTAGGGAGSGGGGSSFPTAVVVILVLLALAAATFGAIEVRRRRAKAEEGPGGDGDPPASSP